MPEKTTLGVKIFAFFVATFLYAGMVALVTLPIMWSINFVFSSTLLNLLFGHPKIAFLQTAALFWFVVMLKFIFVSTKERR